MTEINRIINIAQSLHKKRFVDEKNVIELIDNNQDLDIQELIQTAESSDEENSLLKFSMNQNNIFILEMLKLEKHFMNVMINQKF